MSWIQLRLDTDPPRAELIEDLLLELGASAVTLQDGADQPLFEPGVNERPLWQRVRVSGLFDARQELAPVLTQLREALDTEELPPYRAEILEDRDWEREWMSRYQPIRCGRRLWICPSWREPPEPGAVNLLLDPGLAFGTGTHPTTFLCLQWLDNRALNGKTVVDYGCGSGILGIAALLLGATALVAVDNDPQALSATRDNATRNSLDADRLRCLTPEQFPATLQADLLVANILAGPLLSLAPTLAAAVRPGGELALSGILADQGPSVVEAYRPWFTDIEQQQQDDWLRITARRRTE